MERKKISMMVLVIVGMILIVSGVTYAFWMLKFSQTEEDQLSSSCFNVTFSEEEESAIRIEKAYPILDEEGVTLKPYTFTITNTCNENAGYQINLESLSKSGEITIPENNRLKAKYVKLKINEENQEGSISILGDNDVVKTTLTDAYDSHKLMTGYLEPSKSKSFELRLWLDGAITMEDTEAMNKTFASKITVTASYLKEELIPPTVDLELAVCENTITATGSGKANGEKKITQYEFKIDGQEWTSGENVTTKEFSGLEKGNHVVRLRATDDKGATSEVSKNIEVGRTINIYGKDIPVTTCNNGLYEVEHKDAEALKMDEKWQVTEYRYAGRDYDEASQPTDYVHNYVTFNNEKWQIIGLVNVKTSNGNVEQRLKIIRDDSIGNFSWDHKPSGTGSSISEYGSNDWTDSQLMETLNDIYYKSENGECWMGDTGRESSKKTCKFDGSDGGVRGLNDSARKMIDENIIWNIGGWSTSAVKTEEIYAYERGNNVYGNNPVTWPKEENTTMAKIGLMYPSDYGYATNGGILGRDKCFKTSLYVWKDQTYQIPCANNDWLKPSGSSKWLLTPNSLISNSTFLINSSAGALDFDNVFDSVGVWPTLYLSKYVQIVNDENDGSYDKPYNLRLVS